MTPTHATTDRSGANRADAHRPFIFISGATLLVYSAERLIGSLVGVSRGLRISVFLLAIIFTGIEFDDIVLGVALNLEGDQNVALGLVLGTAVSFSGIVLALGAILTPTQFNIPRDYIIVFAAAPLIMLVFAVRKEVTTVDAIVLLLLFVVWIAYVAVRESRRETATFRNLEIVEEIAEDDDDEDGTSDPVRTQAVSTMSVTASKARCSAPRS
jgi:cation:H+ antiporter